GVTFETVAQSGRRKGGTRPIRTERFVCGLGWWWRRGSRFCSRPWGVGARRRPVGDAAAAIAALVAFLHYLGAAFRAVKHRPRATRFLSPAAAGAAADPRDGGTGLQGSR